MFVFFYYSFMKSVRAYFLINFQYMLNSFSIMCVTRIRPSLSVFIMELYMGTLEGIIRR